VNPPNPTNNLGGPNDGNHYLHAHVARMVTSFRHWTGKDLIGPSLSLKDQARELFYVPFAILSHDTAPDPVLNYANQTGLRLFGLSWDELFTMPSRLTAQALEQGERARLLSQVSERGYIHDYRGIRITKDGRRFLIERATVWNLLDESGGRYGQAATFSKWRFLD
jgi:hypothetical protein